MGRHATPSEGRRRGGRRWLWVTAAVLVVALGAAGTGAYALGWVDHWRGTDRPAARPVQPLPIGTHRAADDLVAAVATGTPRPAAVRAAVRDALRDGALGSHVLAQVAPVRGAAVLTQGSGAVTPASTLKLLTTAAALHELGPGWQGTTQVRRQRDTLTIADHGDVLLSSTDLDALATRTAAALKGARTVTLRAEKGWYAGPRVDPHWPATYVPEEVVAPIVPLWVDEGHTAGPDGVLGTDDDGREADPTAIALQRFAAELAKHGVKATLAAPGPATGTVLATHTGAPLDQVVTHILQVSDNEGAETLGHLIARDRSFAGGASATLAALRELGVPTGGLRLYDASGLSREDRATPAALVAVLQRAAADPRLGAILQGLPVAGWSGSLEDRFHTSADGLAARGVAHAKTGTLTGVSALAGTVTDAHGVPMVVVVMADRVTDTLAARAALDRVVAALAACDCS